MFSNKHYWCICFNIAIAASLFNAVARLNNNHAMAITTLYIMGVALLGAVVCLLLRKKFKTPPPKPLRNLGDLFLPYSIALSTEMFSIEGVPTTVGYCVAIGFAIVILIANSMPYIMPKKFKERNS